MKKYFFIVMMTAAFAVHAQAPKAGKKGNFQVKVAPDKTMPTDEARVTFKFIGPDNKPAVKHVKVVCNFDSAFPQIDAAGTYTVAFDPGKYKMRFSVPFWHEIKTDSILLKKQTSTTMTIKFEAKDIK